MDVQATRQPNYLILGASGGIGTALARRLSAGGAGLLLAGRDASALETLGAELEAQTFVLDATRCEEVEACVARALESWETIDGIANCVGSMLLKPAHLTKPDEWRDTIDANLGSAFATVRAAARPMMREGGSIVLVASAAARTGLPNHEAIAAAKAGVVGLTLASAATYAGYGIRVNAVAPGLVETPLTERITSSEPAAQASRAMHALGRLGKPADIASAIAWLLDPEQSWVTGQVLGVDGGLAHVRPRVKA
jgi:NAD(P)-dependent dehydrogenase (short-subunit alcohol dehydrogenase family)